jgi:signal transduction histidine kinase
VTETGRQLTALLASAVVAVVILVAYVGINQIAVRVEEITQVATDLSEGMSTARTTLQPVDEVGRAGQALNRYADYVQEKRDELQNELRRQRREITHLTTVLESMPDGVIVQDGEGRVTMMNDRARDLLGSQRVFRSTRLDELADVVSSKLGPSLAPGLYALGDPHRIHLDDRMLSAQAAAIMSATEVRLGTVVMLRDITDQVRLERERDIALQRLARDIQQPLAGMGMLGMRSESNLVNAFARELTRQTIALRRMIIDMRSWRRWIHWASSDSSARSRWEHSSGQWRTSGGKSPAPTIGAHVIIESGSICAG